MIAVGLSALFIANIATRGKPLYCPACRTQKLMAVYKSVQFRCTQCDAEFTRMGVNFVRVGVDEEKIPHATAKLKGP